MNENLNLVEILKDVPEGTDLWSPLCGVVIFKGIKQYCEYPIRLTAEGLDEIAFNAEGKYFSDTANGECLLFPSKDQRDWAVFAEEQKQKKAKLEVDVTLHPFDRVLVRDIYNERWQTDLFQWIEDSNFPFMCMNSCWEQCIPYCEETAALLGTSDPCEIKYNITASKTAK